MLSTLQEISLHQLDLTDTTILPVLCKRVRILHLQANNLTTISHLGKLKALEYLNLAMNNISSLQGLQRCESLAKLDLTLNAIASPAQLLDAVQVLQDIPRLQELYLMGNACQKQVQHWRTLVVGSIPTLRRLVGGWVGGCCGQCIPVWLLHMRLVFSHAGW